MSKQKMFQLDLNYNKACDSRDLLYKNADHIQYSMLDEDIHTIIYQANYQELVNRMIGVDKSEKPVPTNVVGKFVFPKSKLTNLLDGLINMSLKCGIDVDDVLSKVKKELDGGKESKK